MTSARQPQIPRFDPPDAVGILLDRLEKAGFEGWAVGGCVRDLLAGRTPHDWDLCTSATPQEMLRCFAGLHLVETGLQHGTLTVWIDHLPYEVTSYRVDGEYQDKRRPNQVRFVRKIETDLARRDFTVNAMAWHPQRGLLDPFGGRSDLAAGLIRCVGNPADRFSEDALRILRALRFAAVYGFSLEMQTEKAAFAQREGLLQIAPERVREEFFKLICGRNAAPVLRRYLPVLAVVLPELAPMEGFLQQNIHHDKDVFEHSLAALEAADPGLLTLRLAALLHDVGKPLCFTWDENGVGHFYGHAAQSAQIAKQMLHRLHTEGTLSRQVVELIRMHDLQPELQPRWVRRWLARLGEEQLLLLLELKRADVSAQAPAFRRQRLEELDRLQALVEQISREEGRLSVTRLAVNGQDILALGVPQGPQVGGLLKALLEQVLDGQLPNERTALLKALRRMLTR